MRRWLILLCAAVLSPPASAQETPHSLRALYRTPAHVLRAKDLAPDCPVAWNVRTEELHGGRQEGVQLVHIDNGTLRITVIPTRGMGLFDVAYSAGGKERRLGWVSPVHDVVNPAFVNPTARGGLGWLEGFNEFMCRCGLENVGQPGKDVIVTNTGARAEIDLTLHGKIANSPASRVELLADAKPPYRIRVRGVVYEKMLFGPMLELHSEFSTEPGSMAFRVEDRVVNVGSRPQEFQVLYHTNFGKPLLDGGSRFHAAVRRVTPVNAHSAKDVKTYGLIGEPTSGAIEQVYFMEPLAGKDGRALAVIHDKAADAGVSMRWPVKQLPYLTLWKNTAAVEDGYVVGIEPGTSFPNTRRAERQAGRVPTLAAGAAHVMTIDFAVHVGGSEVRPVVNEVGALQQTQPPQVDEAPPKGE